MPYAIATMNVGLGLIGAKRFIERANSNRHIEMEYFLDLETKEINVWGVGESAVIGHYIDDQTTELNFIAVKEIPLEWELNLQYCMKQLRDAFEDSHKLISVSQPDTPGWDTSLFQLDREWFAFGEPSPSEKESKQWIRDLLQQSEVRVRDFGEEGVVVNGIMTYPNPLVPRILSEEEIEQQVEQHWFLTQQTHERRLILSALWKLTTKDATIKYLTERNWVTDVVNDLQSIEAQNLEVRQFLERDTPASVESRRRQDNWIEFFPDGRMALDEEGFSIFMLDFFSRRPFVEFPERGAGGTIEIAATGGIYRVILEIKKPNHTEFLDLGEISTIRLSDALYNINIHKFVSDPRLIARLSEFESAVKAIIEHAKAKATVMLGSVSVSVKNVNVANDYVEGDKQIYGDEYHAHGDINKTDSGNS